MFSILLLLFICLFQLASYVYLFWLLIYFFGIHVSPFHFSLGKSCHNGNGGCSHTCIDQLWGALCTCPTGMTLSVNGLDCEGTVVALVPLSCLYLE